MTGKIYLIEFNQNAESTLNMINIDLLDAVARARSHRVVTFGRDDSGWTVVGWAESQKEAHDLAEAFLHNYFSNYPEKFPTAVGSTSNLSGERKGGYDPNMRILPKQTYK